MEDSGQRQQKQPQSTSQASSQQNNATSQQALQQSVQSTPQQQQQTQQQQPQKHHPFHHHTVEGVEVETAGAGVGGGVFPQAGTWLCCLPCAWLRGNTSVHKASLTAAMLLVMSLLVASPVLFLISSAPSAEKSRDCLPHEDDDACGGGEPPCQTLACRGAAERVEAAVTWTTDPCKDFYKFACGGWGRHQALTALQDRVDADIRHLLEEATSGPFQKLGDFYNSCLRGRDMSLLSPMFTLLDELGGYLPPSSQGPPDLSTLLSKLLRVNGAPLFDAYVERDLHNGSRLVIFIDLPSRFAHTSRLLHHPLAYHDLLFGQAASVNLRHRRFAEESRAYVYLKDSSEERRLMIMEGLVQKFLPATMAGELKTKEANNILLFASLLSKLYPRAKDLANRLQRDDSYECHNLTQFQKSYNFVQWKPLLEHIFSTNITVSDTIYVMAPTYMHNLGHLLSRFQTRVIHNSLLLIYATDILHELVNSTMSDSNRPGFCTRVTVSVFSKAVSTLYITQYTSQYLQHLNTRVKEMFSKLKQTLERRIEGVSWMDDESKAAALKKLSALRGHFMTWPQLWNQTYLDSLLQDITVDPNDFFHNVMRRYRQLRTFPVDFHTQQPSDRKWAYPFVVNAFYEVTLNSIVIPLAVLTQPYFRTDMPLYVQYGTIGLIFSHEILHGFDLTGALYGENGERNPWMSASTRLRLEARLECVAKQYADAFHRQVSFLGTPVDVQFDWNVTRNENMADVSGLEIAFETWLHLQDKHPDPSLPELNLRPDQLFFLHAAQVYCTDMSPEEYIVLVEKDFHTPAPERVNGIMMNSQAFADAYKCPVGTKMNPAKKCSTY